MLWRNEASTLANSFDSRPKVWPEFYSEFLEQYFVDAALPPLFVLHGGRRAAFIRFRRLPSFVEGRSACDISIIVPVSERGKGVAKSAIRGCVSIPRNAGLDMIVADIKTENLASVGAFSKAGFQFDSIVEHDLPDGTSIAVNRYTRPTCEQAQIPGTKRTIGSGHPCFIIAEAGSNWRLGSPSRDLKMARALIDVAAEAGG